MLEQHVGDDTLPRCILPRYNVDFRLSEVRKQRSRRRVGQRCRNRDSRPRPPLILRAGQKRGDAVRSAGLNICRSKGRIANHLEFSMPILRPTRPNARQYLVTSSAPALFASALSRSREVRVECCCLRDSALSNLHQTKIEADCAWVARCEGSWELRREAENLAQELFASSPDPAGDGHRKNP